MTPIILFDDGLATLSPLNDLRPAFDIRTGCLTTFDRLNRECIIRAVLVPEHLRQFAIERLQPADGAFCPSAAGLPILVNDIPQTTTPHLLVNSRCPILPPSARGLQVGSGIVEAGTGHLIAAMLSPVEISRWLDGPDPCSTPRKGMTVAEELPAPALLSRPWHIRTFRDATIAWDLDLILGGEAEFQTPPPEAAVIGSPGRIKVHATATVSPTVVLDSQSGLIIIDEQATIRPGAVIIGPAYIGPHTTVLEHAVIRSQSAIGPWCKIAGEITGTIFQGYANKAHEGFLGDSYVGEWANLGAGTTNSNLLNTYSPVPVRSQPAGPTERTGQTFMGCIIGDHARFAIHTRIMTGAVIHTGVMWAAAAAVTGCIPRFAWVTDEGRRSYRLDKFIEVARTVMARRGMAPSQASLDLLARLHAQAQN